MEYIEWGDREGGQQNLLSMLPPLPSIHLPVRPDKSNPSPAAFPAGRNKSAKVCVRLCVCVCVCVRVCVCVCVSRPPMHGESY